MKVGFNNGVLVNYNIQRMASMLTHTVGIDGSSIQSTMSHNFETNQIPHSNTQ